MFKSARKCPSFQLLISVFLVASLVLLAISNVGAASSSSAIWVKLYGGALDDEAAAIVQIGDRGYSIAGTTYSFGAGCADFWLVKVDSSGNMQWNQTYGGAGKDFAYSMVQTTDGGYALAGPPLVKTDSEGNMQWNQTYGEYWSGATSVIQTSDNGYALAGTGIIVILDAPSDSDAWLIKTDSEGIVPEFPSWTPISLALTILTAAVILYKRRIHKPSIH